MDVTIQRWLALVQDEELELECGEDIDRIQRSIAEDAPLRILEQIKDSAVAISLHSPGPILAIVNFRKHLTANPHWKLRFRFVTTSGITTERPSAFPDGAAGIVVWQEVQQGKPQANERLSGIRQLLATCKQLPTLGSADWAAFQTFVSTAPNQEFLDFVQRLEWSVNELPSSQLRETTIELLGARYGPSGSDAETLYERLFLFVFKTLSIPGPKRLNQATLELEARRKTPRAEDQQILVVIRSLLRSLEERVETLEIQHREMLEILTQSKVGEIYSGSKPDIIVDAPPLVDKAVPREGAVLTLLDILKSRTWCGLVGPSSSGKTQLLVLLWHAFNGNKIWVRLRHRSPEDSCLILDRCLEIGSGIHRSLLFESWYNDVCRRLGSRTLILIDDLEVSDDPSLEARLSLLTRACAAHGAKIVSTSHEVLHAHMKELLGDRFYEVDVPAFTGEEVRDLLGRFGAPPERAQFFTPIVVAVTRCNAALVRAAAQFLSVRKWAANRDTVNRLLLGDFAKGLEPSVRKSLIATTTDDIRELIYRLRLVGIEFSRKDLDIVAAVTPPIRMPMDKLSPVIGLWIQKEPHGRYSVSPLLDRLQPDLSPTVFNEVHLALGEAILQKRHKTLLDGFSAINHFIAASQIETAAYILAQGLSAIVESKHTVVEDWGFTYFWADSPLPRVIPLILRLYIRGLQVAALYKKGRPIDSLLEDFDRLADQADQADLVGVVLGAGIIAAHVGGERPIIGNACALRMLRATSGAVLPNGEPFQIPTISAPENVFWMTAHGIRSSIDLSDWVRTISQLSKEQQLRLLEARDSETGLLLLCDGVWDRERKKPPEQQDWESVDEQLQQLEELAAQIGHLLFRACVARSRIIAHSELQGDLRKAKDEGVRVYPIVESDAKARFVVAQALGQQFAYHDQMTEAREWTEKAAAADTMVFPLLRRDAFLLLSRANESSPAVSLRLCARAVEIVRSARQSTSLIAATLGEYAIMRWKYGDRIGSFSSWQEAVSVLMSHRSETAHWKRTFVVCGHCVGYYASIMSTGAHPTPDHAAPYPGIFGGADPPDELYDRSREPVLFVQIALLANKLGLLAESAVWVSRGMEDAERIGSTAATDGFAWLGVPDAINRLEFKRAIELARITTKHQYANPDDLRRMGIRDPETWEQRRKALEQAGRGDVNAMLIAFLPIAIKTACEFLRNPDRGRDLALTAAAVCDGISRRTPEDKRWEVGTKLITELFVKPDDWRELIKRGEQLNDEGETALGEICYLGVILWSGLAQSLATQCHLFMFAERYFSRAFEGIYSGIICPFAKEFWKVALKNRSFDLRMPIYTAKQIQAAFEEPAQNQVKPILRAAVSDLGIRLPIETREWLFSSS